jgi:hypothetical protein
MSIDHLTGTCDSEAARMLPWLVAGRLGAAEAARVESHLVECETCRRDRAEQQVLRGLMREDDRIGYSPQPAMQKLMSRIDELERELPDAGEAPATQPAIESDAGDSAALPPVAAVPRWLMAALVVQTLGLGLLGATLWRQSSVDDPAAYRTLSSTPAVDSRAPQVRVVFAPDTTVAEVARMVGAVEATIVAGPSEAGAYTLALPGDAARPSALDTHVAQLRADTHVLFAEPVVAGTEYSR